MALIELEAVTVFRLKQHLDGHPWPSLPEDVRLAYGELEAALGDFVWQDCGVSYVMPLWWRPGDRVLDPTHGRGNWCKTSPRN